MSKTEKDSSQSSDDMLNLFQKVSLLLGSLVSLGVVTSVIWYAAIAANDLTHAVNDANKNITKMYAIIEKKEQEDIVLRSEVSRLAHNQDTLIRTSPALIHVDRKYAVMEAPTGGVFRLAVYNEDDDEFE